MFYMYTEDGIVREDEFEQREGKKIQQKKTMKKRPTSKQQSTVNKRPQSGKKNIPTGNEEDNFPKAKGLV